MRQLGNPLTAVYLNQTHALERREAHVARAAFCDVWSMKNIIFRTQPAMLLGISTVNLDQSKPRTWRSDQTDDKLRTPTTLSDSFSKYLVLFYAQLTVTFHGALSNDSWEPEFTTKTDGYNKNHHRSIHCTVARVRAGVDTSLWIGVTPCWFGVLIRIPGIFLCVAELFHEDWIVRYTTWLTYVSWAVAWETGVPWHPSNSCSP